MRLWYSIVLLSLLEFSRKIITFYIWSGSKAPKEINPVRYYRVYKAEELGYHPQVILAGRSINDSMPGHVARMAIMGLNDVGKVIRGSNVLIMGLTYKEDVPDIRESQVFEIVRELKAYKIEVYGYDPLLSDEMV